MKIYPLLTLILYCVLIAIFIFNYKKLNVAVGAQNKYLLFFGLVIFYIPLSNTWGARVWRDLLLNLHENPYRVIFLPEVIGVFILLTLMQVKRRIANLNPAPCLLLLAYFLILSGAFISTCVSINKLKAFEYVILSVLTPGALFVLVRTFAEVPKIAAWLLLMLAAGSIVPLGLGIITIFQEFGVPVGISDLFKIKMNINQSIYYGVNTFGNSGHMADFSLIILPIVAVLATSSLISNMQRWLSSILVIMTLINIIITFSRSALVSAFVLLFFITFKRFCERGRWLMLFFLVLFLVSLFVDVKVIQYFMGDLEQATISTALVTDSSYGNRFLALGNGLRLIPEWGLFGVGYGGYADLDSSFTSPHNLIVQAWVEGGILTLAGLLLLFAYVFILIIKIMQRDEISRENDYVLMGSLGCFVYLANSFISGSVLVLDGVGIWVEVIGILLAFTSINNSLENVN